MPGGQLKQSRAKPRSWKGIEVIKLGEMSGQLFFIRDELGAYGAKIGQFESRSTDHFWSQDADI